jgi:hypothetical protein
MGSTTQGKIKEVFLIKTDDIDFFAALVKDKGGKTTVKGRIRYKDGTHSIFHSPVGEPDDLRKTLMSVYENMKHFDFLGECRYRFHSIIGHG